MIKITLFLITAVFFSACVNKHGISAQPFDDCKEYYDFQGYYHKDCGDKDIVTYKAIGDGAKKAYDSTSSSVGKAYHGIGSVGRSVGQGIGSAGQGIGYGVGKAYDTVIEFIKGEKPKPKPKPKHWRYSP